MSQTIRLITDEVTSHIPNPIRENHFTRQKSHIIPKPAGKSLLLAFAQHSTDSKLTHPLVHQALDNDLAVLYLCDKLPEDMIYHKNLFYLECPDNWFIHTLFMNPLQFCSVFSTRSCSRLAAAFSTFTGYNIPVVTKARDLASIAGKHKDNKDNILVEIRGGIGDHLLSIPALKTLSAKGKRVHVLCDSHRADCFRNLPYIERIYADRKEVNMVNYSDMKYLHFGQHLNDYRMDMNKQNRIFSVAQVCGLQVEELVTQKPEIILTKDEISNARRKYNIYPNKIFVGADSARVDAKLPADITQTAISRLKNKGFTVFTSSNRRHSYDNCIDLNKKLSVRELFALIAVMDCVLTVDTAFLHIAAAFDKPTICLMNYFKPEWRCGTYKNCEAVTPQVSCFPCVAKQFVPSCEWNCTRKSCYSFFDWENIYKKADEMKSGFVPSEIQVIDDAGIDISRVLTDDRLPGEVIHSRKKRPSKRVAAFWLGGMGDAVMLGYLCRAIKRQWPDCTVDAFVRDQFQTQLFVFDYPDIKAHYSNLGWSQTVNAHKKNFDVVYDFRRWPYVFHTFFPSMNTQPFREDLYNNWGKAAEEVLNTHDGEIFKYYAEKTGLSLEPEDFRIPMLADDTLSIKRRLSGYKLPEDYIILNCGCDQGVGVLKLWSKDNWAELVKKLSDSGKELIQVGSDKDIDIPGVRKIKAGSVVDLMYITSKASLVIGNEGGLIHLAHAVGTRSVVLFGPTNPKLYGYKDNINLYQDSCETCWWNKSDWSKVCRDGHKSCINLDTLNVNDVYFGVMEALNK